MVYYVIINLIIISSAFLFAFKNKDSNKTITKIYLSIIGTILILFSGLRGDFTSDYIGYSSLFSYYNTFSFKETLFKNFGQEKGYVLLNRFVGLLTDNVVFIMIITSLIVIILYLKEIKKYSECIWISILLFVTIGQYYTSFNLIRQIIAAGIIFNGSKYLYERNFKKYLIYIIIGSLFHKTAMIMLPFYFILNMRFTFKQVVLVLSSTILFFGFTDTIISYIQKYFYSHYLEGMYGMQGYHIKNVILPIVIFIFVFLHQKYVKLKSDKKLNIWVNSVMFYTFFSVLGLKIQMLERISAFFAPYVLLIFPYIIMKLKNKELRLIYIVAIVFLAIVYNFITLSGTGYDPYYFFWN